MQTRNSTTREARTYYLATAAVTNLLPKPHVKMSLPMYVRSLCNHEESLSFFLFFFLFFFFYSSDFVMKTVQNPGFLSTRTRETTEGDRIQKWKKWQMMELKVAREIGCDVRHLQWQLNWFSRCCAICKRLQMKEMVEVNNNIFLLIMSLIVFSKSPCLFSFFFFFFFFFFFIIFSFFHLSFAALSSLFILIYFSFFCFVLFCLVLVGTCFIYFILFYSILFLSLMFSFFFLLFSFGRCSEPFYLPLPA